METTVRAEYVRKALCQKCYAAEHDVPMVQEPYRKVVQSVRGVVTCANCGKRVTRGYVVIYESTHKRSIH